MALENRLWLDEFWLNVLILYIQLIFMQPETAEKGIEAE